MTKYAKGKIIQCVVTGIAPYGAFVSCDDYYTGLIHISEINNKYIDNIDDYLKVGDIISAEVLDVDNQLGRLKLSIKNINYKKKNFRKKLRETKQGFHTLEYFLPIWIKDSLERMEKDVKNKK